MYGCLRFRVWGRGFRVKAQNPKTQTMSSRNNHIRAVRRQGFGFVGVAAGCRVQGLGVRV